MKRLWNSAIMLAGLVTLTPFGWTQDSTYQLQQLKLAKVPAVGEPFVVPSREVRNLCQVSAGQLDLCVGANIDGVIYTIAYRKSAGEGCFVTRVYTDDSKFKSPEGLRVGDEITLIGPEDIFESGYFEVYARKGTRWIPVIGALGKIRFTLDGKQITEDSAEKMRVGSPKPIRVWISGFIEMEDKK